MNEVSDKKVIEKINNTKVWLLKRVSKMDNLVAKLGRRRSKLLY